MASHRTRLWLIYPCCLLLGILLASTVHAPARLIGMGLALIGEDRVALEHPAGTVWSGSTDLVVRMPGALLRLPDIHWQLGLSRLWRGQLVIQLATASAELEGSVELTAGIGQQVIRTTQLRLTAGLLASQIPALAAIGPSGELRIAADPLTIDHGEVQGNASVRVTDARSNRLGAMGDYLINLTGVPGGADLFAQTVRGPVRLDGRGQIQTQGGFRFLGSVRAEGPERDRLTAALSSFGVPRSDGSVRLAWPIGAGALSQGEAP